MEMTVYSNNTVGLRGIVVGRVKGDSYQMLSGVRGRTTFYSGVCGTFDKPHEIDVPLYVPSRPGSVSDWKINPAFEAEVCKIVY